MASKIIEQLKDKNIVLLDEYVKYQKRFRFRCHCGNEFLTDGQSALSHNGCGCVKDRALLEKIKGNLAAKNISLVPEEYKGYKNIYRARCNVCLEERDEQLRYLLNRRTIGCSCRTNYQKEMIRDYHDKHIFTHRVKKTHLAVPAFYYHRCRTGAIVRKIDFNVTREEMSDLLEQQKFTCKISKLKITLSKGHESSENTASLDRIDNSIGYVVGNLQWIHKNINMMKRNYSQEEFIEMCRVVAKNNRKVKH